MKILIVKPRLDISFKKVEFFPTYPSYSIDDLPEIRKHWWRFVENLIIYFRANNHDVEVQHVPLWFVDNLNYIQKVSDEFDIVLIPHREKSQYPENLSNLKFYMQTTFPEYFTLDSNGWSGSLSSLPLPLNEVDSNLIEHLRNSIKTNISKFEQPTKEINTTGYWLFVCQLPHDAVIKLHSDISVENALIETLKLAEKRGKRVIVKGHPVNLDSMKPLIEIASNFNDVEYVDDVSIHSCLANCEAAFMVNSGVGLEALIHEVPVVIFGKAEYQQVVNKFDGDKTKTNINRLEYKKFLTAYFKILKGTYETEFNNV